MLHLESHEFLVGISAAAAGHMQGPAAGVVSPAPVAIKQVAAIRVVLLRFRDHLIRVGLPPDDLRRLLSLAAAASYKRVNVDWRCCLGRIRVPRLRDP